MINKIVKQQISNNLVLKEIFYTKVSNREAFKDMGAKHIGRENPDNFFYIFEKDHCYEVLLVKAHAPACGTGAGSESHWPVIILLRATNQIYLHGSHAGTVTRP